RNCTQCIIIKLKRYAINPEKLTILLNQRVSWLCKNGYQCIFIQFFKRCNYRHTANKLRDQTKPHQILRLQIRKNLAGAALFRLRNVGTESHSLIALSLRNHSFQARKGSATDK